MEKGLCRKLFKSNISRICAVFLALLLMFFEFNGIWSFGNLTSTEGYATEIADEDNTVDDSAKSIVSDSSASPDDVKKLSNAAFPDSDEELECEKEVDRPKHATVEDRRAEIENNKGLYAEDSIVLNNTSKTSAERLAEKLNARLRITTDESYAVLYLPEGTTISDVFNNDENKNEIPNMSPDYYVGSNDYDPESTKITVGKPQYDPDDPNYGSQQYLDYINLHDTWNTTKGAGITVAIIDSGIDVDHPEFAGKISEYSYYASQDKVVKDYDMSIIDDEQGHGTAVAGVIAAAMDNAEGIVGIAPDVTLLIIKCDVDTNGEFVRGSDAVFGLAYAIEADADVINMSFGSLSDLYSKYTKLAVDSDIICVAAAGNDGSSALTYPACLDSVIGVGALDTECLEIASYSNFGENVDLLAPGTAYTTAMGGGYQISTGTSMSAPMVSAAAALYLSMNSHTEFSVMKEMFEASSVDIGILGADFINGFGALDVYALVCEEKGTITYDMLTDEVENETQVFVKGHTVQKMSEPERSYMVYDGWFFDPNCTDEVELYTQVFSDDITLYANWINEDEGTAYTYVTLNDGTVEIRSYTGKRRYITVPAEIEGKPVTSIGEMAFANNSRIRSVILPKSLTNIGMMAFQNCPMLREIEIPEKVKTIGNSAFSQCGRLSNVQIYPNGALTSIAERAFEFTQISSFTIPSKLVTLEDYAFWGCTGLRKIEVADSNLNFIIINNALYNYSRNTLLYYPAGLPDDYVINSNTNKIGNGAFAYSRAKNVTLNDGLVEIGEYGFANSKLTKVKLTNSVMTMGNYCFYNDIALSDFCFAENNKVTIIPEGAFCCDKAILSIVIPKEVELLKMNAFSSSGLNAVTFENNSVLSIIEGCAFNSTFINKITIPSSVSMILNNAFANCCNLNEVVFESNINIDKFGDNVFEYCYSLKGISLPSSLKEIGKNTFYGSGLETISIPQNLNEIGDGSFGLCRNLKNIVVNSLNNKYKSINGVLFNKKGDILIAFPAGKSGTYTIPDVVNKIGNYSFSGAEKLSNVIFNENVVEIGEYAFEQCVSLKMPQLPASLNSISAYAFYFCKGMKGKLCIPKSVNFIGAYAFMYDYELNDIEFEAESEMNRLGYASFAYCGINDFTLPRNISTISQEVFNGCDSLITITFESENKIINLPAWCFKGAKNLRQITFEDDCEITLIAARAFDGLSNLEKIDFSGAKKLKVIGNYAFYMCTSLKYVELSESLEQIGRYAFYGCKNLEKIILESSINHIGRSAFANCGKIYVYFRSSSLPVELETGWDEGIVSYFVGVNNILQNGDFKYAITSDGNVSIIEYKGNASKLVLDKIDNKKIVSIGGNAFKDNTNIVSLTLPDTITSICKNTFSGTINLENIIIPASVEIIDAEAFKESGIKQVIFENGSHLKTIGAGAFYATKNLKNITLPTGVKEIKESTFEDSAIETIDLNNVTNIERNAFANSGLVRVVIPSKLINIGSSAFINCTSFTDLSFEIDNTALDLMIRDSAFYNTGLVNVEIPSRVNYIGELCFSNCENLISINVDTNNNYYKSFSGLLYNKHMNKLIVCPSGIDGQIVIPSTVISISYGAFEGSMLSNIIIPENSNLLAIGPRVFYGCKNLTNINIPDSIQSIGAYAFSECNSLMEVNISETSNLGGIYEGAFYNCGKLEEIRIPDNVQEICEYAFYGCTRLKNVYFSQNSKLLGIYDHAFEYSGIENFDMPSEMLELGDYAFHGADLNELTFNKKIEEIGSFVFLDINGENITKLIVPDSVYRIDYGALAGLWNVKDLYLPFLGKTREDNINAALYYVFGKDCNSSFWEYNFDNIVLTGGKNICGYAFANTSIKSITLAEGYEIIPGMAFSNCELLETVNWPDSMMIIEESAFYHCVNLKEIKISKNVELIKDGAFYDCTHLNKVEFENDTFFEKGAFANTDIEILILPEKYSHYVLADDILYTNDYNEVIFALKNVGPIVKLNNSVKIIGPYAFAKCLKIEKIVFPDGLLEISAFAFEDCCNLTGVILPDGLTKLEYGAFRNCYKIDSITIPDKIMELSCTFENDFSLKEVVLNNNVEYIYNGTFAGTSITEIVLPDSLKEIRLDSFNNCNYLKNIYIGADLYKVYSDALNLPALESIDVSSKNKTYASKDGLLYTKDYKELLLVPKGVVGVVSLESELQKVGNSAFYGCKYITEIIISDNLTEIGDYAFTGCENLKKMVFPSNVKYIGNYCCSGCINLENIRIDGTCVKIGYRALNDTAFYRKRSNCFDGVVYCGEYALGLSESFDNNTLSFKKGTKYICDNFNYNNESVGNMVESIVIGDGVEYIGEAAFSNMNGLKAVTIIGDKL